MLGDIITYDYFGSLYINLTNRCDCRCIFCIRDQDASALGGLWLRAEPTCRADDLFWICDRLHEANRPDLPPIRLNTNGHGSLINHRDIAPEMKGRLDAVSVSLNASNEAEYLRLTRPGMGAKGWQAMLDFVKEAKQYVPRVAVTVVDYDQTREEIAAAGRLAAELGADFRVRPFG